MCYNKASGVLLKTATVFIFMVKVRNNSTTVSVAYLRF